LKNISHGARNGSGTERLNERRDGSDAGAVSGDNRIEAEPCHKLKNGVFTQKKFESAYEWESIR
jgi:hypothetical protein